MTKKELADIMSNEQVTKFGGVVIYTAPETSEEEKRLEKMIAEFAQDPDIIELVKRTEAKPETTKGHYGDYGAILAGFKENAKFMALVLIRAGANAEGVKWGLKHFVTG